jgi:hypothetical protein
MNLHDRRMSSTNVRDLGCIVVTMRVVAATRPNKRFAVAHNGSNEGE